ncbi:MAG: polyprenol monophosphomannose synthase [Chloroflexi bacterium]|nr:polyprenol monophosphomannose synthase [Chloroflexota bacterium]MBV9544547.1 polyprenol monophosphomannose synthase [Chloroflexota bacterium]
MHAPLLPGPLPPAGRTLVVLPTYNERENLPRLVPQLLAVDSGLDILVVDDGSPDGTGDIADGLALADQRIRVLHRPCKQGLGTAYLAGFRDALANGYVRVVEMDADFSHRPADLPRLLQATAGLAGAHVAIGSRLVPGGAVVGWSALRHTVSQGGSLIARVLLGLPIRDCTSGFKCFRREALEKLDLGRVRSTGFAFQVELNHASARAGLRLVEVPITFRDRVRGTSKMSWHIVAEALWIVLVLVFGQRLGRVSS